MPKPHQMQKELAAMQEPSDYQERIAKQLVKYDRLWAELITAFRSADPADAIYQITTAMLEERAKLAARIERALRAAARWETFEAGIEELERP